MAVSTHCVQLVVLRFNLSGGKIIIREIELEDIMRHIQKNPIEGLPYDIGRKSNCANYEGNQDNWQGIYQRRQGLPENEELSRFIDNNKSDIAKKVGDLIGFYGIKMQWGAKCYF